MYSCVFIHACFVCILVVSVEYIVGFVSFCNYFIVFAGILVILIQQECRNILNENITTLKRSRSFRLHVIRFGVVPRFRFYLLVLVLVVSVFESIYVLYLVSRNKMVSY